MQAREDKSPYKSPGNREPLRRPRRRVTRMRNAGCLAFVGLFLMVAFSNSFRCWRKESVEDKSVARLWYVCGWIPCWGVWLDRLHLGGAKKGNSVV